ncbi:gastrula zinc finger protein XlCGF57.1 isoform X2 [Aethina tumida]|uniref:gastrula zinc finger protein XlCGF57.1 isoform X2 n=1 Tax=Aethina tumida TaxID=116153 RepID=UPI002148797C|nr:gastrula zinc finger protein XlCGF57.1 isoform X2 [Aethina tumida]
MSSLKCHICFKQDKCLFSVQEQDENCVILLTKLENIVPELAWYNSYLICKLCKEQIENCYNFKLFCLSSSTKRDSELFVVPQKNEVCIENIDLQCFDCNSQFYDKDLLSEHLTTHQNKELDVSKLESASEEKPEPAKENKRRQTTLFTCEICAQTYKLKKNLIIHCSESHNLDVKTIRPYTCANCPKRFRTSANLIQHRKYHEGVRSYICSFCGKGYITHSDLLSHEKIHHNKRSYGCNICNTTYNTNKALQQHKFVVHTDPSNWKYSCDVCLKRFPLKGGYSEHMKRHEGVKQHSCLVCGKRFVSKVELSKHKKLHSNFRGFKCSQCPKEYKDKFLYEVHLTKVHGIGNKPVPVRVKKHTCHICPSSFYDKHKLARHLCTHSGVKPFSCTMCDKKFTDRSYLNQHMKKIHEITKGAIT